MANDQNEGEKDTHIVSTDGGTQKPDTQPASQPTAEKQDASDSTEKARQTLPTHPVEKQAAAQKPANPLSWRSIKRADDEAKRNRLKLRNAQQQMKQMQADFDKKLSDIRQQSQAQAAQTAKAQASVDAANKKVADIQAQADAQKKKMDAERVDLHMQLFRFVAQHLNEKEIQEGMKPGSTNNPMDPQALEDVLSATSYDTILTHGDDPKSDGYSPASCFDKDTGKLSTKRVAQLFHWLVRDKPYLAATHRLKTTPKLPVIFEDGNIPGVNPSFRPRPVGRHATELGAYTQDLKEHGADRHRI